MNRTFLLATVSIVCIAGCSNEPPKCSDPGTLSLIREIIIDRMGLDFGAKLNDTEIENALIVQNPRAITYDEKVKKYSCGATLIVPTRVNDMQFQVGIEYDSQLDDNKRHLVVLTGLPTNALLGISQALLSGIAISRSAAHPPSPESVADATPASLSYSYEPTIVSLEGQLLASEGQTSDGKGILFPAIQLAKPITVKGDQETQTEEGVVLMQLVLDEKNMELFEGLKGKSVVVSGTLFHADNGNHYTNVLLTPSTILQK